MYKVAMQVLKGEHAWLEQGIVAIVDEPASASGGASRDPAADRLRRDPETAGVS
jgi:hypothetical protein